MSKSHFEQWQEYCKHELAVIEPILAKLGFELEFDQPHIKGERYLMRAVQTTSGKKLILLGRRVGDKLRVVIKITNDSAGSKELVHERYCREVLHKIKFAYQTFLSPQEIIFTKCDGYTISIQVFVEQRSTFLERPIREQFSLALRAFEAQESAHAATYEHARIIKKTFGSIDAVQYLETYRSFKKNIELNLTKEADLLKNLARGEEFLVKNQNIIAQYCNFLTHTDFVPHNFRVSDEKIYLLDHSSLRFGNKYEGWARFLNFMTLYNPELESCLLFYVKNNRTEEEYKSLLLMRIFRLAEIIWYYTNLLSKTEGDLQKLNKYRVDLWGEVLRAILNDESMPTSIIENYKKNRDSLRSKEEKERQIGLH